MDMQAMWVEWCKKFLGAKVEPMDDQRTKAFLICSMGEDRPQLVELIQDSFPVRLFLGRASFVGLECSYGVQAFIPYLCDSPGAVVMWVNALRYIQQVDGSPVTMDSLARKFPIGFPTRTEMSRLWEAQKGHVLGVEKDNFLDMRVEIK